MHDRNQTPEPSAPAAASASPGARPRAPEQTGPYVGSSPGQSPTETVEPTSGWLQGRYEVLAEIASGGMGVVYQAVDHAFKRVVAVKVLKTELAGPAGTARFRHEAEITGQLQHPGVPACYDVGALPDGRSYLVIKLIQGQTLAEHLTTVERSWQAPPPPPINLAEPWSILRRVVRVLREARAWLFWRIGEGPTPSKLSEAAP